MRLKLALAEMRFGVAMIECPIFLCAEGVSRDSETGSLTIYNVLEDIQAEGFPILIQRVAVLAMLKRDASDPGHPSGELVLKLGETVLQRAPVSSNFQEKLKLRQIIKVNGLVVPSPGIFSVSFILEGRQLGEFTFTFTSRSPATVQTT